MKDHAIFLGCVAIPIANSRSLDISKITMGAIYQKRHSNHNQCAKRDIIFSSFSYNFHDDFVERGIPTMVIST